MDYYGVTYAYFCALYEPIDESTFDRLLVLCAKKLDLYTHNRAQELTESSYKLGRVRDALCAMISHMSGQTAQGTGVSSVSNDGYTETYQASTPEAAEANLRSVCAANLSGTGLMSAL